MTGIKSILFVTEANENIGFGHFSRSIELYKEFDRSNKFNLLFLAFCRQDKLKEFLAQRNIISVDNIISLQDYSDQKIIELVKNNNHSCVIFDTHNEHKLLRSCFDQSASKTISLDFFYEDNIPDASINLFNHRKLHYSQEHQIFSGPEYAIVRDEFKKIRDLKISNDWHKNPKKFLILMGGADPQSNSLKAINIFKNENMSNFIDAEIQIVIGPLFSDKLSQSIFQESQKNGLLKIFEAPKNIEELFLDCDVMFCGGGTTLLESMSVGMPTIVIPQSDEEFNHAKSYHDRGACILLDDPKSFSSINLDFKLMQALRDKALSIVDQRGKERIIQIVEDLINE